jgi:hypothetical protein
MAAVPSLVHAGAKLEAALQMVAAKQIDDAASALFALLAEVEKDCETYSVDGTAPKELLHFKARVVSSDPVARFKQAAMRPRWSNTVCPRLPDALSRVFWFASPPAQLPTTRGAAGLGAQAPEQTGFRYQRPCCSFWA